MPFSSTPNLELRMPSLSTPRPAVAAPTNLKHRLLHAVGIALLASAALLAARSASAQNVQWSIGINLPQVGAVINSQPVYLPPPVVYSPPPRVVYLPPRRNVYVPPPTIYYAPAPVYYHPPRPVYVHPGYSKRGHGRWKDRDDDGYPDRWERRRGRDD